MRLPLSAFACFALAAGSVWAQTVYTIDFDATADNTTTAPFVGSGTVTIANAPASDGTFALSSLGAVTFSFTFPALGLTFTNAQISTPANQILFRFTTEGNVRRLQFSNTNAIGGGPLSGAIDFGNFSTGLSFQPPGPPPGTALNQFALFSPSGSLFGNYYASQPVAAVPEPGTILAGAGAAFLLGAHRCRRWRIRG